MFHDPPGYKYTRQLKPQELLVSHHPAHDPPSIPDSLDDLGGYVSKQNQLSRLACFRDGYGVDQVAPLSFYAHERHFCSLQMLAHSKSFEIYHLRLSCIRESTPGHAIVSQSRDAMDPTGNMVYA